jgi:hypothetical protein
MLPLSNQPGNPKNLPGPYQAPQPQPHGKWQPDDFQPYELE